MLAHATGRREVNPGSAAPLAPRFPDDSMMPSILAGSKKLLPKRRNDLFGVPNMIYL